ncbi:hypothetical protein Zmor_026607 [Zophobas morio]|uniref:Spp2/MOS2 G-patch domain-containing protein n=1 Tax=Zophobas morio TaxID=2755281 RepID=A0AA38M4K8_9CUCU|nr:hypothetical protein Zmor_026607 [Zophobas morio]
MENKKISFGFSKVSKRTEILSKAPKPEKKVELIDCLEGQSIKIKDAVEETNEPLIIPIQGSSNKLLDQVKKAKEKRIKEEVKEEETVPDSELTLNELAARELIREAQNRGSVNTDSKIFALPLKEEKFVAEGAEESSLEDYEHVPISDYGMAMLRGMNWKEGMPIGKRTKKTETLKLPELRPKGLGLGANKMVNSSKPSQAVDKDGKELQLVKGAFCKIIAGNHRGHYCEVQGLDDENCRAIVKTAITNEILSLNEFLIVLVNKEEFEKNSRVINNAKYEEYQEKSRGVNKKTSDEKDRDRSRSRDKRSCSNEKSSGKSRKRHKKKSKKNKHKYSSDSEDERRKHKKKGKSKHDSSDSDSEREYRRRRNKDRK